jgi:hypothetical protein
VNADYDGNGLTSFAEAHAYAVIESHTLDVPVRTSEALLRVYSRLGGPYGTPADQGVRSTPAPAEAGPAAEGIGREALREPSGSIAALATAARSDQQAILEKLAATLADRPLQTVEDVRVELELAHEELDEALDALQAAMDATDEQLAAAQDDAYRLWPELYDAYSTDAAALTGERSDAFVASIEPLGSYATLRAGRRREAALSEAREAAECKAARLERLLRTIEDIVLAENLPRTASPKIVARYKQLVLLEEQTLE